MKHLQTILLIAALGLLGLGLHNPPVEAVNNPIVYLVDVNGNAHTATELILGAIVATRIGEPLNSESVRLDLEAIMKTGYFADARFHTAPYATGVKLIFDVIENPIFKAIKITGLTSLKPEELQTRFTQKPGEVFNTVTFHKDLNQLKRDYREQKGLFLEQKLENKISADGMVILNLTELKLGKIRIVGLEKTKEFVVRRELAAQEGEVLNTNIVKADMARLSRLQFFESINPKIEASELPDALDLIIELKETANTGTFMIGGTYKESTGEVGCNINIGKNNLMGLGQSVSFDANVSENSKDIAFDFFDPWINERGTSFRIGVWNSDSEMTSTLNSWGITNSAYPVDTPYDLDLRRTGISVALGHKLRRDTSFRLKCNLERNTIENFYECSDTDQKVPLIAYLDQSRHPREFWDNSLGAEVNHNKLVYDGPNFVTGGYRLFGSCTFSGPYLGGEYDYQSGLLEGKWFYGLTNNLVLGTRFQGNFIEGDYPDYDRLYLGGETKLRGYKSKRYSNNYTRGMVGSGYLLSNTELRYRLPANKAVVLALFYDAGQLTGSGEQDLKYDYGIGFRYSLPVIGQLRIDRARNSDGETRDVISFGEAF